jgi:hypothetical protein
MAPLSEQPLTFELLDDLMLAHERQRMPTLRLELGTRLGPLVELHRFREQVSGIQFVDTPAARCLQRAIETRLPQFVAGRTIGFVPACRAELRTGDDIHWTMFMVEMHKAMIGAGWPSAFTVGLVGAMDEMQNNIHDHSAAADTGIIGYSVGQDSVEWVVADRGIGILSGLQSGTFPSLTDSGEALKLALMEGRSRLAEKGRGNGFRELFKSLAARHGMLRFRSDDQLLTMSGVSPALNRARLQQRAHTPGFSVCILCTRSANAVHG